MTTSRLTGLLVTLTGIKIRPIIFNLISFSTYLTIPISYLLQHEMKGRDRHQINKVFLMLLQLSGMRGD
jgi:hypothetical protein